MDQSGPVFEIQFIRTLLQSFIYVLPALPAAASTPQQLGWVIAVETTWPTNVSYLVLYRKNFPTPSVGVQECIKFSSMIGYSEFLKLLWITAMNTSKPKLFFITLITSLEYALEFTGKQINNFYSSWYILPNCLPNICASLHPHQLFMKIFRLPHPCQNWTLLFFTYLYIIQNDICCFDKWIIFHVNPHFLDA